MPLMEGVVGSHVKVHIRDFDSQMLAVAHLKEKLSFFKVQEKTMQAVTCNILVPRGYCAHEVSSKLECIFGK